MISPLKKSLKPHFHKIKKDQGKINPLQKPHDTSSKNKKDVHSTPPLKLSNPPYYIYKKGYIVLVGVYEFFIYTRNGRDVERGSWGELFEERSKSEEPR